jgi:hypothetical protein
MKFKDRDEKDNSYEDVEDRIHLHHMNLYDQGLFDLKQLVNEKAKHSGRNHKAYDMAIKSTIDGLYELVEDSLPAKMVDQDIEEALKGGKYRKIYYNPEDDSENDIIQIRGKKIVKAKPKRKPVKKVVKKCKCK